ncbi:Acid stress-induced BolA-like protein IbaG/YrbA, predicted regulator of iron metabolism [Alteromonadaceae bacterium Bs31]|nr:Acid stress-induced BolA-like protein IbaG/YrbA, predicted regulator of iron metabolism [Alteromonadaceae bacterium Bs31]
MDKQQLIDLIQADIPGSEVFPEGEDCDFTLNVISESFMGMRPVAKQQRVLSILTELISSGELHSVSVKAFTANEWTKKLENDKAVQIQ